jgi:hypothetical protein
MDLMQQVTDLVEDAPDDLREAIEAIAPVLAQIASQMEQLAYWVGCDASGQWLVTTLQHPQTGAEKNVIYCFAQEADLSATYGEDKEGMELPIVDLVFQLLAMESIDQLIFFKPHQLDRGRTVDRVDLKQAIEAHLRGMQQAENTNYC